MKASLQVLDDGVSVLGVLQNVPLTTGAHSACTCTNIEILSGQQLPEGLPAE
jgi:hypothetical protein